MKDLRTEYLGLELETPFIVASSGLTKKPEKMMAAEKHGAGAIVLKSLFEEQIMLNVDKSISESIDYPEAADYIKNYTRHNSVNEYLDHIKLLKKELNIPIIASINCTSNNEWTKFAEDIEKAGADALELNMNIPAFNIHKTAAEIENEYFQIVEDVKSSTKLNVAAKISKNFTALPYFIKQLNNRGINSFVLFNKFFDPIINTDTFEMAGASAFSNETDIKYALRWIAITKGLVKDACISGSSGVFDYDGAAQMILAGASSVQLCSVLYKKGVKEIATIKSDFIKWMDENGFNSINDFKAKLSYQNIENSNTYERFQFMKQFSGIE